MVTAFAIVLVGLYQLLFFRQPDNGVRYISSLIVMNGVSSFLNHRDHHVFFSYVDGASMILAVNLAAAIVAQTLISLGVHDARTQADSQSCTRLCWRLCSPCKDPLIGLLYVVCCVAVTCIGLTTCAPLTGLFESAGIVLLFNLPILGMVIALLYLLSPCGAHLLQGSNARDLRAARAYAPVGISSYLVGFVLWNIVEGNCAAMPDSLIAIAHSVWHLTATYGLHILLSCMVFLRAPLAHGATFRWATGPNAVTRAWFVVFPLPIVDLDYKRVSCLSSA